jgi:hypothetical protein
MNKDMLRLIEQGQQTVNSVFKHLGGPDQRLYMNDQRRAGRYNSEYRLSAVQTDNRNFRTQELCDFSRVAFGRCRSLPTENDNVTGHEKSFEVP